MLSSVDTLFQESIQRLYIHFSPNVVVLYGGINNLPDVAYLVEYSYKSSVLINILLKELGKLEWK